jgi:hypothetical protein
MHFPLLCTPLRGRRLIAFGPATELNPLLADAEFFSLIEWDTAAPRPLRQSAQSGDWQRTIGLLATQAAGSRRSPIARKECDRKLALWSLHDLECPSEGSRLIAAWQAFNPPRSRSLPSARFRTNGRKSKNNRAHDRADKTLRELTAAIEEWSVAASPIRPIHPLELLIVFEILRDAALYLPSDGAARLWRAGLAASIGRTKRTESAANDGNAAAIDLPQNLAQVALAAELDWQAGLLFAPVAGSASLREDSRKRLWSVLADSSDSLGVPVAHSLRDLSAWMTSVVRAREWGRIFGRPLFTQSQEKRLRGIVTSVAKFCGEDGKPALADGEANGLSRVWATAAATFPRHLQQASPAVHYLLSLAHTKPADRAKVGTIARNGSQRNGSRPRKSRFPVFQSDESRLACLRNDWIPTADSILVSHQGRFPTLEMALGGATLLSGDWKIDLQIDGRPVEPADWSCVCWYSDDDGDYLELQTCPVGVRVERQIFLSRTDDFALLADAVRADGSSKIEITSGLPLSPDCAALAQTRTRECRLLCDGAAARVFPLALSCPRVEGTAGGFSATDGRLELNQSGLGSLYAPLVLDWHPGRRRSSAAWRRLTVALGGAAVPPAEAAGFLLEIGLSKWLIYRSLSRALEPRSVLGQHTMYETLVGRFVRGDVESIVQIEQAAESNE